MSKTLQFSVFTNLRIASSFYTPAHSKNGVNVSQRLLVNAYLNENRRGAADDKSNVISLTAWSKAADILALCLTPGKEFTAFCDLNVYEAPVYHNDQPVQMPDGTKLMRKAYSYTIRRFDLGNDAFKHIMDEIQRGVRGQYWWVKGHQDAVNFKAELDRRMALVGTFNPQTNAQNFGFARVKMPAYQFGAYNPNAKSDNAPVGAPIGTAPTAETVAAAFSGNASPFPAQQQTTTPTQNAAPTNPAASFVMPQSSMPAGV
jgi:hypothetical protein